MDEIERIYSAIKQLIPGRKFLLVIDNHDGKMNTEDGVIIDGYVNISNCAQNKKIIAAMALAVLDEIDRQIQQEILESN